MTDDNQTSVTSEVPTPVFSDLSKIQITTRSQHIQWGWDRITPDKITLKTNLPRTK